MSRRLTSSMNLVLVLTLWGCTIQAPTEVAADGSGRYLAELGLTEQDRQLMQSFDFGRGPETALCDDFFEQRSAEVSVWQESRSDEIWCVAERSFSSLVELRSIYESEGLLVRDLRIDQGRFYYELVLDTTQEGLPIEGVEAFIPEMTWRVEAPGRVLESNADRVEGRRLTWLIESGQRSTLRAETAVGSNFTWIWLGLGLAVCALGVLVSGLAAGLVWFSRRRKRAPA